MLFNKSMLLEASTTVKDFGKEVIPALLISAPQSLSLTITGKKTSVHSFFEANLQLTPFNFSPRTSPITPTPDTFPLKRSTGAIATASFCATAASYRTQETTCA